MLELIDAIKNCLSNIDANILRSVIDSINKTGQSL